MPKTNHLKKLAIYKDVTIVTVIYICWMFHYFKVFNAFNRHTVYIVQGHNIVAVFFKGAVPQLLNEHRVAVKMRLILAKVAVKLRWVAAEFRKRRFLLCSVTVLHGLQKSLPPDSQKFVPNSLVRPCLLDGSDFLFFHGETVRPGAGRLRNWSIINDKKQNTVLQDDNCKHTDLIKASTDILLISIAPKRPDSRSQNAPTVSKRPNLKSQNGPTISKRHILQYQNFPTI